MRRTLTACVVLVLTAGGAAAQAPAPRAEVARLAPPRRLIRGAEALPQIATPANTATARINGALRRQDQIWLKGRAECRAQGSDSYVERGAQVTMLGPEFFAVQVGHEAFCAGAAHPNAWSDHLTYDLRRGAAVNWARLIPRLTQRSPAADAGWGDVSAAVTWPAANKLYAAKVRASEGKDAQWWSECQDEVLREGGEFLLHPDAKAGGLALEPNWLPHAAQACGVAAVITPAELRRMGAERRLVEALEAAHRLRAFQPEPR